MDSLTLLEVLCSQRGFVDRFLQTMPMLPAFIKQSRSRWHEAGESEAERFLNSSEKGDSTTSSNCCMRNDCVTDDSLLQQAVPRLLWAPLHYSPALRPVQDKTKGKYKAFLVGNIKNFKMVTLMWALNR